MGDSRPDAPALNPDNLGFVEDLYLAYLSDPESVDPQWRASFIELQRAEGNGGPGRGPRFVPSSIFSPPDDSNGTHERLAADAEGTPAGHPATVLPPVQGVTAVNHRVKYLRNLGLFANLPIPEIFALGQIAEETEVEDGLFLFETGEVGADMFVVLEGKVSIERDGKPLRTVHVGESMGEMAMIDKVPRAADAIARGKVRLLKLSAESFWGLMHERPKLARAFVAALTRQIRETGARQDRVDQLIRAYRVRGHMLAELNPLGSTPTSHPELDPAYHGFTGKDLDEVFSSNTIPGPDTMKLRDIIAHLQETYCRTIGVQFMHIDDVHIKMWLQERMERTRNHTTLVRDQQIQILTKLTRAELFEQFIHRKFVGAKRFSLEGGESLIPLLDLAVEESGKRGIKEIVIGMAHRGRLNVLANIVGKSPRQIFHEFDDTNPDKYMGSGDVKYHLGYSNDVTTAGGGSVHISLTFNPSHLEFVGPVVQGRTRAKQERHEAAGRDKGLSIVIHGDAAFAGEGVVQESLNMSMLPAYDILGTIHIIVNNQIGFTTNPEESRSSQYCTDVAKMRQIPILHVNGEDPEGVAQAIRLALDFREEFKRDVVIDMYCYRRYGHNEGDEPAFTQPLLYKTIRARKSVREGYLERLFKLGSVTEEDARRIALSVRDELEKELQSARAPGYETLEIQSGRGFWVGYHGGRDRDVPDVATAVDKTRLQDLLRKLARVPGGFTPHPKIQRILEQRLEMADEKRPIDWATAEQLALGSLLIEGAPIRFTGQDVVRGTFSHRHAGLFDVETGKRHVPLQHLSTEQGRFEIYNSPLTETAVVGFEYGYSLDLPEALVIWEAQFGDFFNVAQVITDQFIISGEDKWSRLSGLVCLLPHGFEGQGPEHSSARLERLLTGSAEDNIQVVNASTPAQYFHLLRRQLLRKIRKPLFVMAPKSLLRHPMVASSLDELATGSFERVIPDRNVANPKTVRRVLIASGKIYYDLLEAMHQRERKDVAIVRLEQYYPTRSEFLESALSGFPAETPVIWVQEEPRNMGAWSFLSVHYGPRLFGKFPFTCLSRPESASPATGSGAAHKKEQAILIDRALED